MTPSAPSVSKSDHRVLVVDDDPDDREQVCGILASLGFSTRVAVTVDEALAALLEEEFCLLVVDQALPVNATAKAMTTGGERLVRAARQMDKRRTADGDAVTPILAVTSHSERSEFVTGLFEIGISTFVAKPVADNASYFVSKVQGSLAKAGRGDHAACAGLLRRVAREPRAAVSLAVLGHITAAGRSEVEIGGEVRSMQDRMFLVLLRSIVAREREPGGWSSRDALGIGANRATTTIIRETFAGLVPAGFDVLPGDRRGNFRLNPEVAVARVDWDVLARHPDAGVQRLAVEQRKRVARG